VIASRIGIYGGALLIALAVGSLFFQAHTEDKKLGNVTTQVGDMAMRQRKYDQCRVRRAKVYVDAERAWYTGLYNAEINDALHTFAQFRAARRKTYEARNRALKTYDAIVCQL